MDFGTQMFIKITAAVILCFVFIRLVMRGKWVAWAHPICSACGFNLSGLPATSTNCPECGGELASVRKNAVWRRRWLAMLFAALLTLVCVGIFVAFASQFIDRLPTFALMPFRQNAKVGNILQRRLINSELTPEQAGKVVEQMIAAPGWGQARLIETLRAEGKISDVMWKKYASWVAEFPVTSRANIGHGDPLVIQVQPPYSKLFGTPTVLRMKGKLHVKVDGHELPVEEPPFELSPAVTAWPAMIHAVKVPGELKDGAHNLDVEVECDVSDVAKPGEILTKTTTRYSMPIFLLPEGKSPVELAEPENERMQPRQPQDDPLIIVLNPPDVHFNSPSWFPKLQERDYAYKLIAKQNGQEIPLGQLALSHREYVWIPSSSIGKLKPGKCEVIFKTDAETAKLTTTITRIVDFDFIAHDAQVTK